MRSLIALAAFALVPALFAQDLGGYLRQRSALGIRDAAGVATLETFLGERTVEIRGVIKGSIRSGDSGLLMLEADGGRTLSISADPIPTWMRQAPLEARLIVRATRAHETAALRAILIAGVPERDFSAWQARQPKPAPERATAPPRRSTPSGRRPPPMQGEIAPRNGPRPSAGPPREWNLPASDALPFYRDFIRRQNRRLSEVEVERIARGIIGFSLKYGVDARLITAMIITESNFRPNLTSHKGAMGLGQLMPGTARALGVSNAYDSVENLYGMIKLVRQHIDRYGRRAENDEFETLVLMLAAYNAGPGAVSRHGGVPPFRETQNYVRRVLAIYRQLTGESP